MFFKSKKLIAIDLGSTSIKVCELDVSRKGATLLSFVVSPTPSGAITNGEITNPSLLASSVQLAVQSIKSRRKSAAAGVYGTPVVVRRIKVPKMDDKILSDQLKWEAEQYIPFDVNEISLTHHKLKAGYAPDTMDILLVAAQNQLVRQYFNIFGEAGLGVGALDVNGFALANNFEMNYGKMNNETIALLNIGASTTNLVVMTNGETVFCRDIPVGGSNYSTEIQKELGISFLEAESLKISAVTKGETPGEVNTVIQATNDAIADEIRNSFDFFSASSNGTVINRAFATGGASVTPGLLQSISNVSMVPVQIYDPFYKISIGNRNLGPSYIESIRNVAAIALGLGLREAGDL